MNQHSLKIIFKQAFQLINGITIATPEAAINHTMYFCFTIRNIQGTTRQKERLVKLSPKLYPSLTFKVNGYLIVSHQLLVVSYQLIGTSYWSLVTSHQSLVTSHKSLVTSRQLLVSSYQSLVTSMDLLYKKECQLTFSWCVEYRMGRACIELQLYFLNCEL